MSIRLLTLFPGLLLLATGAAAQAGDPRGTVCAFPDISALTPVTLSPGASTPAGTGGDIPGGRWELVQVKYDTEPDVGEVVGQARGALELVASSSVAGQGSMALQVTITEPENQQIDETGAGPYSATGNMLDFQNDCGDALTLGQVEYTVDTSGDDPVMTLWGSSDIQITDPFPIVITVFLEVDFLLVEPPDGGDAVFQDRFEG
ncbi:MAG: hypothetical protein HND55_08420 [Pseudomonadota bacterium]|nr:MAG: hypothetical protein HND55_08420 [Pseudomonadota bacterium]